MKGTGAQVDTAEEFLPQNVSFLLGHEASEKILLEAFRSKRMPHAWLIAGPRGIGKATLAYRFARFIISQGGAGGGGGLFGDSPDSLDVPREGPVFRQIAQGAHPNLRVLERREDDKGRLRKVITVPDVRRCISFLQMTAAGGNWRVIIVDAADDLNQSSANALLKMLEEPPSKSLLLLVSHRVGSLLPTIRSRCCRLLLAPLDQDSLLQLIARQLPDLPSEERQILARLAEGAPGRALELAANAGSELYREMIELLDAFPRPAASRLHAFADRLSRDRDGGALRTGGELLRWWVARLAREGAAGRLPAEILPGERAIAARLLNWRPPVYWLETWERLGQRLLNAEAANLDRRQVAIAALLELETSETQG